MYNENKISLAEATVLALQGKLKLEETKSTKKPKISKSKKITEDFKHIDDVWEYLEQSRNEDDLEERINNIPRSFGLFTYDIINDGKSAKVLNQYEEWGSYQQDEVDIDFLDFLDENKEPKTESVEIETDNVEVELEDNGDTTIETDKEIITVSQKAPETDLTSIEEPVEDVTDSEETIDVPVEGDETILPEEEVSEETFEEDNVEDLEESKKCVKEDYEIDQEGNLDIIECEDAVNFVKKNINNMKDIYEDDTVNIYTTGHDYDFIAVILNKTNNVITIKFNDNEIEPITIDKSNWIGLLADQDGYCTLQQVINKDFFIVEDEKLIEDDLEESKKVCEENKECLTEEPVKYEWVLQGNYGYGWDDLVTYDNKEEAERDYKDYRENEPEYTHRIRKRVVKEETKNESKRVKQEARSHPFAKVGDIINQAYNRDGYTDKSKYSTDTYKLLNKVANILDHTAELAEYSEFDEEYPEMTFEDAVNDILKDKNIPIYLYLDKDDLIISDFSYSGDNEEIENMSVADLNNIIETLIDRPNDTKNYDSLNQSDYINANRSSFHVNRLQSEIDDLKQKQAKTKNFNKAKEIQRDIDSAERYMQHNKDLAQQSKDAIKARLAKKETKQTFNKKSFEETLTKFYKFNNENVKSFKVESIMTNKNGSLKIEGKLNDNVPATMIFDKKVEGKSFITYSLRKSNVLKESKEIKTTMLINKKENILNCRNIISK